LSASTPLSPVSLSLTPTPYPTLFRSVGRRLGDAGSSPQQHRGRRCLGDEGERPILEHGDLRRHDRPPLGLGGGVVLLAELHDVEDRKSTRLNSSHQISSYAVFCLRIK